MKRDGRSLEHNTLAELRRMAIQRVVEDGAKPSNIALEYGFCRNYLYPWLKRFRDGGWEALAERIAEGPAAKTDREAAPASQAVDSRQRPAPIRF